MLAGVCDRLGAAARRRRGGDRRHQRRDRARDARDGPAPAAHLGRRAAGRERGRAGQALPRLRRAAARARRDQRAGAADVLRHERAHPLPQRPPDAQHAAGVAGDAGHQRERHHRHRRDLLRRQRLPGRAGRRADRRRRADPADRHRRPVHGRPAHPRRRAHRLRGQRLRRARRARDRSHDLAARLRRDALEGGRGRDGHGGRHPHGDLQRPARRGACRRAGGRARGDPLRCRRGTLLELQAVAEVRQALTRHAGGRRGAARAVREGSASLLPVGDRRGRAASFDAGDAVEIVERTGTRGGSVRVRLPRESATTPRRSCSG